MTIIILITIIFIFLIPNKIQIAAKKIAPPRKNFDKNQGDLNVVLTTKYFYITVQIYHDYGTEKKLEITYIAGIPHVYCTYTLISVTAPSFDFILKKL